MNKLMNLEKKDLSIIILAGGKGVRMSQDIPKVLTELKPKVSLIENLLSNIKNTNYFNYISIVVGYKGDEVINRLGDNYNFVWQREQLGTGHAVQQAKETLQGKYKNHLVLYGDMPFISEKTISNIIDIHQEKDAELTLLTLELENFENENSGYLGFGRIVRDENNEVLKIVEFKDASDEEKKILEVNPAIFCIKDEWLWKNLENIKNSNNQAEYYLTDLIGLAHEQGLKINSFVSKNNSEFMGINTLDQLEKAKNLCD